MFWTLFYFCECVLLVQFDVISVCQCTFIGPHRGFMQANATCTQHTKMYKIEQLRLSHKYGYYFWHLAAHLMQSNGMDAGNMKRLIRAGQQFYYSKPIKS